MQLYGSLARPRQTKERPTCSSRIIGEAETGNGEADMQLHGSLARPRQTKERPTCSCMDHWRSRNRQWRGRHAVAWVIGEAETDKGEAYMQLHGSLARPKQAMARRTCSCMDHWRGRNRQWRGRHAVACVALAWVIGETEAETDKGEADKSPWLQSAHGQKRKRKR